MDSEPATATKVAIITGGASGMGLAVGTALVQRGNWAVHLLDLNGEAGSRAVKSLGGAAIFHKVNVTVYSELSQSFDDIFRAEGRLDFVFGNAGIVERFNLYEEHPANTPPPELDMRVVDINLKAVYTTSYLALHYFRQSPASDRVLILTASCGGLYACPGTAMYSGTKHGVIGFMRSIAGRFHQSGIRCNALCPGIVATNLLDAAAWKTFPQQHLTPIPSIVDTVTKLVDGQTMVDAKGVEVKAERLFGRAVEVNVDKFYFREQHDFCDEGMAALMASADRNNIE